MKISSIPCINKITTRDNVQKPCSFKGCVSADTFELNSEKSISKLLLTHNKPVKIFFSDFDRTIRDTSAKSVPLSAINSLLALQKENIPFVLATGRCVSELDFVKEGFPVQPDFFILGHGSQILDKNEKSFYFKPLEVETSKKLIDFYVKNRHKYPDLLVALKSPREVKVYDGSKDIPIPDDLNLILFGCHKALVYPKIKEVYSDLIDEIGSKEANIEISSPRCCEITQKSVTKFSAAKMVADSLGIKMENAAAIGDANNDLPIIENIQKCNGLGIAMGNSSADLLQKANYITGHIEDDGYSIAIETILKNNKRLSEKK